MLDGNMCRIRSRALLRGMIDDLLLDHVEERVTSWAPKGAPATDDSSLRECESRIVAVVEDIMTYKN